MLQIQETKNKYINPKNKYLIEIKEPCIEYRVLEGIELILYLKLLTQNRIKYTAYLLYCE